MYVCMYLSIYISIYAYSYVYIYVYLANLNPHAPFVSGNRLGLPRAAWDLMLNRGRTSIYIRIYVHSYIYLCT